MLTDEQKEAVREWASQGAGLGDVQKRLAEEFGVNITYLEARMLVAELKVSFPVAEPDDEEADAASSSEEEASQNDDESDQSPALDSNVSVTVDSIAQPQSMVSGRVTFSDGQGAAWYVDQLGRLGLDPDQPDHRPSQEDVMAFQQELQRLLKSQGF